MSEPLTPEEEATLRKRLRLARCAAGYITVDGRLMECGFTLGWHLPDDHAFQWRPGKNAEIARLLATLDAERAKNERLRDLIAEWSCDQDTTWCFSCHEQRPCAGDAARAALEDKL